MQHCTICYSTICATQNLPYLEHTVHTQYSRAKKGGEQEAMNVRIFLPSYAQHKAWDRNIRVYCYWSTVDEGWSLYTVPFIILLVSCSGSRVGTYNDV